MTDAEALASFIKSRAAQLGFGLCGIAPAVAPPGLPAFHRWLESGFAGQMHYLPERADAYAHPDAVLPSVRSVVMLTMDYRNEAPVPPKAGTGRISRYAWGARDYHDVIRERLGQLAAAIHEQMPECRTRGVVDTAPLLERDFARLAGLGWFGKNTMLINTRRGSWFFLAALLLDQEAEFDTPFETTHCGTCTRCLEACPTEAFAGPGVLDARRCISYLTIELRREPVPEALRPHLQDWLFGCDVCQDVCPWNRKAPQSAEAAFQPRPDLRPVDLVELLNLTEDQFRERFRGTPLLRTGREALLRNACLVLGNAASAEFADCLAAALRADSPLIRGAAAWALGRIPSDAAQAALQSRKSLEDNPEVCREIDRALQARAD